MTSLIDVEEKLRSIELSEITKAQLKEATLLEYDSKGT